MALPWGMFGENLSTAGLLEEKVRIGDEFRIGTTRVHVTEAARRLGVPRSTLQRWLAQKPLETAL